MPWYTFRRSGDALLTLAHTAQGITYAVLAALPQFHPGHIPVTLQTPDGRPGLNTTTYSVETLFSANIVAMVATFFLVTGVFHAIRAFLGQSIPEFDELVSKGRSGAESVAVLKRVSDRRDGDRMLRWWEYAVSSTIMIYVIALIAGVSDLYTLAGFGAANFGMIMFGRAGDLVLEVNGKWMTFAFGTAIGLAPWLCIIASTTILAVRAGATAIPFVLSITITLFVLFFSFSVAEVMYIRSFNKNTSVITVDEEGKGKSLMRNVVDAEVQREKTEVVYQILSAVAKTVLGGLVAGAMLSV